MGKPSTTRLSRDSEHSIPSNSKHKVMNTMSTQKFGIKKKKRRSKIQANIMKIYDQLKIENSSANTSISSINSGNDTVIDLDATRNSPMRTGSKHLQNNTNMIVICDDEDLVTSTKPCNSTKSKHLQSPIHCSTPIRSKSTLVLTERMGNINNNCSTTENLNNHVINLTKEINRDSYLTIDLTDDSILQMSCSKSNNNTVIDLANTSDAKDCMLTSVSNTSLSMSEDSDVTILNVSKGKSNNESSKQMRKFVKGISKLDSKEKGKLLKLITQTIFSGCNVNNNPSKISFDLKQWSNRGTETAEDTYIKEVILGQTNSRNSIGSNIYNPERDIKNNTGLRMIVIDGSNVAMQHTMGKVFSVKGLKICIDYFLRRGHVVKAFVPRFRCKFGKSTDPRLLDTLERQGLVIYTPSREIQGKRITSYDDRYIVQCAAEFDGVIVSGDNYRDLLLENPRWRFVIENRLLQFTWVRDMIMFPKDPLGRNGPSLEQFLRHS